ncbi:MAG: hypothetical protein AAGF12_42815 [Myxococcota bacterium]
MRRLVFSALALAACNSPSLDSLPSALQDTESEPEAESPEAEPVEPEATADDGTLPDWAQAFRWSEHPTLPEGAEPLRGVGNGKLFIPKAIYFEPRYDNWALVIGDERLPSTNAMLPIGAQHIDITDLPIELTAGQHEKSYGNGGGFWRIDVPPDGERTTCWNAPNAYILELDEWDIKPYDEDENMYQQAGTTSGRLVLVYGGGGGFARSFAYGTFEDVPIRYRGPPRWVGNRTR